MRQRTEPRKSTRSAGMVHTVQRCCNGCGSEIGDVRQEEIEAAIAGRDLPDVTDECPLCRLRYWLTANAMSANWSTNALPSPAEVAWLIRQIDEARAEATK